MMYSHYIIREFDQAKLFYEIKNIITEPRWSDIVNKYLINNSFSKNDLMLCFVDGDMVYQYDKRKSNDKINKDSYKCLDIFSDNDSGKKEIIQLIKNVEAKSKSSIAFTFLGTLVFYLLGDNE